MKYCGFWAFISVIVIFVIFGVIIYFSGDYKSAFACFGFAAIFVIIFYILKNGDSMAEEFIEWAAMNRESIKNGTALYRGRHVTLDTEVRQFQAAISVLFMTVRIPSRFYFKNQDNPAAGALLYTIFSLVFGWWSLPGGPINTLLTVIRNLAGGHKRVIWDLIKTE